MLQDLKHALRSLLRTPGFTTAAVLTLALGIGANVAVFTMAYSAIAKPLPFPDAERLVWIGNDDVKNGINDTSLRMSQYLDWRDNATVFERLAAWHGFFGHLSFNLTGVAEPERLTGIEVSPSLFDLLGTTPAAGRVFRSDEDLPGGAPVVVLSHAFWQRRFGGRADIVGGPITLNERSYTVVGVLPAGFAFTGTFLPGTSLDVYVPLVRDPKAENLGGYLSVIGKLRPGVTPQQAAALLQTRQQALAVERPFMNIFRQPVLPLDAHVSRAVRQPLMLLVGGVLCVLLIGCANLANLLVARAAARQHEVAVRSALGATTARIFRGTLAESLVLSVAGGALGVLVAGFLLGLLAQSGLPMMPRIDEMQLSATGLVSAFALCSLTTLVFGSLPLVQSRFSSRSTTFKMRAPTSDRFATRVQHGLVFSQIVLAVTLLMAGGLLLRSFAGLMRVDPGFRPDQLIAMRVDAGTRHATGQARTAFFEEVVARVDALPGVESAAIGMNLPLVGNMVWDVGIPGSPPPPAPGTIAFARVASAGYFRTLGIPFIAGRDFERTDRTDSARVVIVNQTLARKISELREPVGSTVSIGGRDHRVVGIVADVRHKAMNEEGGAEFYLPHAQRPFPAVDLVVRTGEGASTIVPAIRRTVWSVDRNQTIGNAIAMRDLIDTSLLSSRLLATVVGAFGAIALLLAALGVYGVVSYGVTRHTNEIGIRMALGAQAHQVLSQVFRQGLLPVALGVIVGAGAALAAGRLLAGHLYGISPHDPWTFFSVITLLAIIATAACWLPARRATRIDPIVALRYE
jgi:putative ABC transport system permease protein